MGSLQLWVNKLHDGVATNAGLRRFACNQVILGSQEMDIVSSQSTSSSSHKTKHKQIRSARSYIPDIKDCGRLRQHDQDG